MRAEKEDIGIVLRLLEWGGHGARGRGHGGCRRMEVKVDTGWR